MNLREQLKQIQFRELAGEPNREPTPDVAAKLHKAKQDLAVDHWFSRWAASIMVNLQAGIRPRLHLDPFRASALLSEALQLSSWTALNIGLLQESHPYHEAWRAFQNDLLAMGVMARLVYVPARVEADETQLPRYDLVLEAV